MCERRFVTMNCHLRNIFVKCPSYVCTKICIWSLGGKHRRVRAARRPPPYEYSALGHTPIYIRTPLCNAPFCSVLLFFTLTCFYSFFLFTRTNTICTLHCLGVLCNVLLFTSLSSAPLYSLHSHTHTLLCLAQPHSALLWLF